MCGMRKHMIVIKLNECLQKAERTLYWLAQNSGVPYVTLWKLSQVTTQKSINLPLLSKVCSTLNCQPGDLLFYVPDEEVGTLASPTKSKDLKKKGGAAK